MEQNKFWGGQSESESSEPESSDNDQPKKEAQPTKTGGMKRWADESSSEDEQKTKRVVKNRSDKRYDQLREGIKTLNNHMKNEDFGGLVTDYDNIVKSLVKLKNIMEQEGGPPNEFIKAITTLETWVERLHTEKKDKGEKLSEARSKAFNTLRARVRKGNREYEDFITRCKENPEEFQSEPEEEQEEEEDSESGGEGGAASSSNSSSSSSDSDSSDSSSDSDSDSDSGSDSGSDSSSSDSESYKSGSADSDEDVDTEAAREKKMLKWLITPEKLAEREKKRSQAWLTPKLVAALSSKTKLVASLLEEHTNPKLPDALKKIQNDPEGAKQKYAQDQVVIDFMKALETKVEEERRRKKDKDLEGGGGHQTSASAADQQEYTPEELVKKVTEIAQSRGRRGFERKTYMDKMESLIVHATKLGNNPAGLRAHLYILVSMVAADFDNTGSAFAAMKIELWTEALSKVNKMLPLLRLSWQALQDAGGEEPTADPAEGEDPRSHARLQELFVFDVGKLDDELYKALQNTVDVYGSEYQEILVNSTKFLMLLKRSLKYFEETKQPQPLAAISTRFLEQVHYKPDMLNARVYEAINFMVPDEEKSEWMWPEDSRVFINQLCKNIVNGNLPDALTKKRRASMCQAYHLALHDHFQAAKDLLNLAKLQEQALESDVHVQILYNRVVAQLGLSAFRLGKIQEAHGCLAAVCVHNKQRELLAQGMAYKKNDQEKTPEQIQQEKEERLRQLPYHMHINLGEVLETSHHICAMLLEIPNMAMQSIDPSKTKEISKVLRRLLDNHDKQPFTGPPENSKEAVVSAAKALQRGDWQSACATLEELKLWDHIDTGNLQNGQKVKLMIFEKIKIEALRTYLFTYASIYDAFHLDQLVNMFDLPAKTVHSIISKMMYREEITAFWDESSKFVLVQHVEPTQLQRWAMLLADKGAEVVNINERLVQDKTGGSGFNNVRPVDKGRWDLGDNSRGGKGRFGKGGGMDGKGKGKGKGKTSLGGAAKNRGWENARGGNTQRGWSTPARG